MTDASDRSTTSSLEAEAQCDGHGVASLRPTGSLGLERAGSLYRRLQRLARQRDVDTVCVDFSEVQDISSAVGASLSAAERLLEQHGKTLRLINLQPQHERALSFRPEQLDDGEAPEPEPGFFELVGRGGRRAYESFLAFAELAVDSGRETVACILGRRKAPVQSTIDQAVRIGVDALPIVAMLSFLLGVVLAFQTAVQLQEFGAASYTTDVVSLGMSREFGPFITAIVLAGRSGSAIAAELSTMEMREENDALRTMGISPIRVLVVPRLVGITLVTPALTLMSMLVGMIGGVMTTAYLGISWVTASKAMIQVLSLDDFGLGLVKSVLFAWVIGFAGAYTGLHTSGDARGIGDSATRAVVASIFFIVVIDSIVTTAWTLGAHG